jgi:hypothetical protein
MPPSRYSQVTSQLGDVLNFQYPPMMRAVINAMKPVMDFWNILFQIIGSSECFGLTGFTSKWVLRVVVLPAVLSLVVGILYMLERHNPKAGVHVKARLFFAVFFCYP